MTGIFLSFFEISVSVSVLIAVLIILAPLLNKRYAAKWKYWIWVFLALRLLIPVSGTGVWSAADALLQRKTPVTAISEKGSADNPSEQAVTQGRVIVELPAQMTTPIMVTSEKNNRNITPLDVAAFIWMTGSLVFISVHLISYVHYRRQAVKRGGIVKNAYTLRQVFELKRELQIKDTVDIIEYPEAASPMMTGFVKPVLILPEERYSPEELYFILKHELVHLKRRDVYIKLLLAAATAVHWFNPFVWLMQKEACIDMELSCDEKVIQGADYAARKAYTEALLSTLHKRCVKRHVLSTQFYGGKQIMKKRFQNILIKTGKKNGAAVLMCAVILTVSPGMLVGCSISNENTEGGSGQTTNGNTEGGSGQSGNENTEGGSGSSGNGNTESGSGQSGNENADGASGRPEMGNSQSAQGTGSNAAGNHASGTASSQIEKLAYIEEFDGEKMVFDEVEWVQVPGERAAELGITEDDAPSGFGVYNEETVREEISLAGDCTCTLLDWTSNYAEMQVTPEELTDILAEREGMPVPYHITVRNNEVISITEQYVP